MKKVRLMSFFYFEQHHNHTQLSLNSLSFQLSKDRLTVEGERLICVIDFY